jgi:ACS family hexuronate transporter-like MFS transporter
MAAAGHQGFSANLFTMSSDLFPAHAVASVVGIGGMAGAIGGMLIAKAVGCILQQSGSYQIPFPHRRLVISQTRWPSFTC